ncbi:Holliday junction branch migration protein RuvA [Helicobacter sp. MIT 99-5507]|uniref:Holliday junction branch migration protein RuvA n=1 Tax=Helicobacter sp. MIT 99-5507 TaxID=152489 RepID=UPI000E1F0C03|nr:Holliday junction branch migration protein RuvA [Helicobacter sp. MIT 99-5507]RDU58561.1 Holliday junction branch migration protein RuvA [Helicobacter sp. MIT 99-5507]
MIAGLIGNVYSKSGNSVLFNVNGVIYEVFMSINAITNLKDNDILLITQIIREDGSFLYGFLQKNEKDLFDTLIKINGIGPKVAMAICSSFNPSEFISIAYNNDFMSLKKVPGIGEKMAKRIIVEISGKLESIDSISIPQHKKEAIQALESLGFKRNDFMKIVENSTHLEAQDIIKEALKHLK